MAENSKIEWTDHTFNPWIGCTKVSPGCVHCYAENLMDTRHGRVKWGKGQPRSRTSAANWKLPVKWNERAMRDQNIWKSNGCVGVRPARPRVFCASLADWLDDEIDPVWLRDLLDLVARTPHLDWLLLTKRPENWQRRLTKASSIATNGQKPSAGAALMEKWIMGEAPANVWIGTSVEDQTRADERIPALLAIPARVQFLSMEPLLGPVNLAYTCFNGADSFGTMPGIHWVIVGGESGHGARPMHPVWPSSLRDQCKAAGVPFLFKQWGEWLGGEQDGAPLDSSQILNASEESIRVGKHAAGRLLDGIEHNEFPQ